MEAPSREQKESDKLTLDPQSTLKSQQHPIQADMDEYERFATLHGYQENQQAEHFQVVLKAVGVERLQNYHDDLEEILSKLKPPDTKQEDVISRWANFFQGYKRSFAKLKKILNLTDANHENQIEQLVELAYFIRFPSEKENSGMSQEEMLTRIQTLHLTDRERFGKLHCFEGVILVESFSVLFEAVGIKKLRVYLTKLENIVELKPPDTKHEDVISQWAKFFQGYEGSFARLKEILKLTDADHESQIKQLVELAHFIRFPMEKEPSERLLEEMLTRIQSDKKSRKSQQQSTAFKRFEKLHGYGKDEVAGKFIAIVEAAGVARLQKYHEELQSLMHSFNDDLSACRIYWTRFYQGCKDSFPELKRWLKLTDQDHEDEIRKFFQLAYFRRFPTRQDSSEMSTDKILLALGPTKSSPKTTNDTVERLAWAADIVREGFEAPYRAYDSILIPTLATLHNYVVEWKTNLYRAPYTSIVGATMSGKTRLVIELAKHVCVVYICLRPLKSTGQPPRSELANSMLPDQAVKVDLQERYARLLTAIFRVVASFFSKPDRQDKLIKDQLDAWNKYSLQLDDTPVQFACDVQEEMKMLAEQSNWDNSATRIRVLQAAAKKMNQSVPSTNQEGVAQLKVLLAIDEARNLVEQTDDEEVSYFRLFRWVLAELPISGGFFSVFTDTTSRLANFSPALDDDPSARPDGHGAELFEPIYQIPSLDLFVPALPKTWRELLSPGRLLTYGGPFYGLYYEHATKKGGANQLENTLCIAGLKLLCRSKFPTSKMLTQSQIFALLGSVIHTRLYNKSSIHTDLVSSHAAHCMFIDPTREFIISDYPSQFPYASAASAFLARSHCNWDRCINVLALAVQNGLLANGDAGEMATRLILIYAMQQTIILDSGNEFTIKQGHSVRLRDFLNTLTGKNPKEIRLGTKSPEGRKRLLDEGRIFFNHFTRIGYTPSAKELMEFLHEGLAVQCKPGQHGLDDLFTIYLTPESDPDHELDHKNITFCGVQTKNQEGSVKWKESCNWCKSFAGIEDVDNPYLILLFSLKAKSQESPGPWKEPDDKDDTGRVHFQFLGLDKIACLSDKMRIAFRKLITAVPEDLSKLHDLRSVHTRDWIGNVTRHYHKTLPLVPSQKPAQKSNKRTRSSDHTNTPKSPKRIRTSKEHQPVQNQGQAMQSDQQLQSDMAPKQKTQSRKQVPNKSSKLRRSKSCPNMSVPDKPKY
ncbi:hypothetical protein PGT21_029374 [Puccinia graminis f. sp. tritici]|uniref:Uncharacterized protein n=1 Tax=Puccinia graminis f. sp. tritici TaxID=56615 RepID=A0A5B0RA95_PUCGR|nr:hypothetical protein PGT21_029374 [Puccinia graminis f. sp. tritici]KAA1122656.1 hypothetical protein PGTUg99_000965 [Puccinia graminis f. sp. tritici]